MEICTLYKIKEEKFQKDKEPKITSQTVQQDIRRKFRKLGPCPSLGLLSSPFVYKRVKIGFVTVKNLK